MNLLPYPLRKIWRDSLFQGGNQTRRYFEGWYFKMVSADTREIYAVIPGIALGKGTTDRHAFIQLINGKTAETAYYSFPFEQFSFSKTKFEVQIGDNFFSDEKIRLAIPDELMGEVQFHQPATYPCTLFAPGIMNWYRFAPFMECYHGVVSLDHGLSGWLEVKEKRVLLGAGRGYTEKDWGRSFPSSWIWMQGNHFSKTGTSFMLSVADIPWIGQSFTGFLGFLWYEGKLLKFGTYAGTKITAITHHEKGVALTLKTGGLTLSVTASREHAGVLHAPVLGVMERRISESIDAGIEVLLQDAQGRILFQDRTEPAGFELVGEVDTLISKIK